MKIHSNENIIKAKNGDSKALEQIIYDIRDTIFNLSLRMLWSIEDAEDATQEIIIKVITNLSAFRGDSKFSTWVYKIATNYLLTTKKHIAEKKEITFANFSSDLNASTPDREPVIQNDNISLMEKELRIGCTNAILFCLNKKSRLAFILSTIFDLKDIVAAEILDITHDNYRQIVSRTNRKISSFMKADCGLVNENAKCKCRKRIKIAIDRKRLNPENLIYSQQLVEKKIHLKSIDEMNELDSIASIYKSNPYYHASDRIISGIKEILRSTKYSIIQNGHL